MITLRQIERLWDARAFDRLIRELLTARTEDSPRLQSMLTGALPAAALGLIRLDEFNQAHTELAKSFVRRILASQNADGGWEDPLVTALCARALQTSRGQGPAVDRAIAYLADMQKTEGAWPKEPIRRMSADGFVTAFVVFSLGNSPTFAAGVRMDDAAAWFERNGGSLDPITRKLWEHAAMRVRTRTAGGLRMQEAIWS